MSAPTGDLAIGPARAIDGPASRACASCSASAAGAAATGGSAAISGGYRPSRLARTEFPPAYLRIYMEAGRRYGIDPWVLAGIGSIETNHGQSTAPGVHSGVNGYGCCAGPMQFSIVGSPSTWDTYGIGGDTTAARPRMTPPTRSPPPRATYAHRERRGTTAPRCSPDAWSGQWPGEPSTASLCSCSRCSAREMIGADNPKAHRGTYERQRH